jgi:hypothetical protein
MLWVWPTVGSLLLLTVGWFVHSLVERAVKATMAENLRTILNADVTALEVWLDQQQANAVAADDESSASLTRS